MEKEKAVEFSHLVSDLHAQEGGCVLCLTDGEVAYARFPDLTLMAWGGTVIVEGKELRPKQDVRKLMWAERKGLEGLEKRPTGVIWSAYDEKTRQSAVGLGVMVEPTLRLRSLYLIAE